MIATYFDLADAVGDWLDRSDLATRIPTFLALVEAKVNRKLQDPDQDATAISTADGDYTALPDDFGEMISISAGGGPLFQISASDYAGLDETVTGTPRGYSIVERSIAFAPRNAAAEIRMVYRVKVPALTTDAPTNWLLTRAPDVYLYGALVEASAFLVEDQRAIGWKALFDEAVSDLMADGVRRRYGSGPLAPRIRRT